MIRDPSSEAGSPATLVRKYLKLDKDAQREIDANNLLSISPYTVKANMHLQFDAARPRISVTDLNGDV